MLKQLRIQNLVLVESSDIEFNLGLNAITGETGSGKSALMNALSLVAGERADVNLIRHGSEKGIVEAVFSMEGIPEVHALLDQSGIDLTEGEDLYIRREIHSSGKSRAFLNNQLAQIAILKKVGEHLFEIVGQHANQKLFSVDHHRRLVDLFGDLEKDLQKYQESWKEENRIREDLETLVSSEAQRLRDIEVCLMELEELQEAKIREGEDEELFAEYALLTHAEELAQKSSEIYQALSGERHAALPNLIRQKSAFDQLIKIDPTLEETFKAYNSAILELQEIAHTVRNYQSHLEHNPGRASIVNERLTLINRLKRKYGNSVVEINTYLEETKKRLASLEGADNQITELREKLENTEKQTNELSQKLTKKRIASAGKLSKAIVEQLRTLNMPKVDFHIDVSHQKRTGTGDDRLEFFLIPNVGERSIPVKDCASGGEISRLMLALQALLAGKENIPTLVFDEIDANIGGQTASVVGDKLKQIGTSRQVLCITHFPQVASQADHHVQISKQEEGGRTFTQIAVLDGKTRTAELVRMQGG
jgi:DNA repair protein RecN (Recombination protein N)